MKVFIGLFGVIVAAAGAFYFFPETDYAAELPPSFSETEAGFTEPTDQSREPYLVGKGGRYALDELVNWERPNGPLRVGLQVGHLDNEDVPEELAGITRNGAGATYGQYNERDTVAVITELVAAELEAAGIVVDILPATVPPGYLADAFVSIHADGNPNTAVRGYKMAGPRRDYTGRAEQLVAALYDSYGAATALRVDPSVSRRMTAYYAFNWPRYEHAVHPMTPAVIVETGFLTNATDRNLLLNEPRRAAAGIATGILNFLNAKVPPAQPPMVVRNPNFPLQGEVVCAPVRADRRDRDDGRCTPSVRDEQGTHYILLSDDEIATSSLPFPVRATGTFRPVQTLDNYFWFQYEVAGMIESAVLESG